MTDKAATCQSERPDTTLHDPLGAFIEAYYPLRAELHFGWIRFMNSGRRGQNDYHGHWRRLLEGRD